MKRRLGEEEPRRNNQTENNMNQTHVCKFTNGNRLVCRINISALNRVASHERLKNPKEALRALEFTWDQKPTPDILAEYRPFAQKMYGVVAKTVGLKMLIRGPSEEPGKDESWVYEADGTLTVHATPEAPPPTETMKIPDGFNPKIDLEEMQRLGRLSQKDAQDLHALLCQMAGMTEEDEVVASWNVHSPLAPWNCPPDECEGPYVQELTGWVLEFMRVKMQDKEKRSGGVEEKGKKRFFRALSADELVEAGDRIVIERTGQRSKPGLLVKPKFHGMPAGAMKFRVARELPADSPPR